MQKKLNPKSTIGIWRNLNGAKQKQTQIILLKLICASPIKRVKTCPQTVHYTMIIVYISCVSLTSTYVLGKAQFTKFFSNIFVKYTDKIRHIASYSNINYAITNSKILTYLFLR